MKRFLHISVCCLLLGFLGSEVSALAQSSSPEDSSSARTALREGPASAQEDSVAIEKRASSGVEPLFSYLDRSISPERDSLEIMMMRARLDSIRQHRPTVALVLSGGGAKGAAHIGALHYLDSLKIPVDLVLGTSMGGLMGGLVSMGYRYDQIDTLIRSINWTSMMRDKLPRSYSSYQQVKYKEKYLLSMPFYYLTSTRDASTPRRHSDFHISGTRDDDSPDVFKDNLLGSLPSGYVYGQNVSNLFSSLTVGYQDEMNFIDLPVPYACISTELGSGKTKVWYEGPMNTALRATMSIPGVFTPLKYKGMVLVDGGMRDNYPTALAKYIGADIIIGVDVTSPSKDASSIRNIGNVISQSMDMFGREVYERNVHIPDVTIKPDLEGLNMLSFSPENIDKLIKNGFTAAREQDSLLRAVKARVGEDSLRITKRRAINLRNTPVRIREVRILGVEGDELKILQKKLGIHAGDLLSNEKISDAIAQVYATGAYDYVTYELHGTEEPFELDITCKKGPVHQLGIGVRGDTEELVCAALNVGLFAHRLQGSTLNLSTRVSRNAYFDLHYSYDSPYFPTVNLQASARWTQAKMFQASNDWPSVDYFSSRQSFYISGLKWSYFDIQLGVKNDLFCDNSANPFLSSYYSEGYRAMNPTTDYMSLFADAFVDTFDDGYFPSKGLSFSLGYDWTFTDFKSHIQKGGLHALSADFKAVIPGGKYFAVIPAVSLRYLFGDYAPLVYSNVLGGSIAGRYFEQQLPFIGFTNAAVVDRRVTMARVDFRVNFLKNHYVTLINNVAFTNENFKNIKEGRWIFGEGLQYSYRTIFGPISANVHWSSLTRKVGAYVSLGYDF